MSDKSKKGSKKKIDVSKQANYPKYYYQEYKPCSGSVSTERIDAPAKVVKERE